MGCATAYRMRAFMRLTHTKGNNCIIKIPNISLILRFVKYFFKEVNSLRISFFSLIAYLQTIYMKFAGCLRINSHIFAKYDGICASVHEFAYMVANIWRIIIFFFSEFSVCVETLNCLGSSSLRRHSSAPHPWHSFLDFKETFQTEFFLM